MSLLAVENLESRHGLLKAVRQVSFSVAPGETIALVGANGAGKTTLLRTIAGAHRSASGRVLFKDADITTRSSHARTAMGIALVPEGRKLFGPMTVEENLLLARSAKRDGRWNIDAVLAAFPNLKARLKAKAGSLSGGEQQAAAIGRALMTNPEIILLDEVSLGLSPLVVERVYAQLAILKDSGVAMVLVEQDLGRAMSSAARTICMLEGRIVIDAPTATLTRQDITKAYFGLDRAESGGH